MKLYEKQGITDNISILINTVSDDIIKCVYISESNQYIIKKQFKNRYIRIIKTKYGYYISFLISSEKENINIDWLNNNTKIIIKCIDCIDYSDYINKKFNFKNNSRKELDENNTVLGYITLNIFRINVYEDEFNTVYYYFNNEILSKNNISAVIRHELNHMRKPISDDIVSHKLYNESYMQLLGLINGNSIISEIAYAFYMVCIRDERNAHIEQFYQEYNGKSLQSSNTYNKLIKNEKLLNFLIRRKDDNKFIIQIYNTFSDIFKILFGIKFNNENDFYDKLINHLYNNIQIMKKLIYRAANLYISENEYINEHKFIRYF